jgi:DNA repair exonuclease SbcCD ATPase subunit
MARTGLYITEVERARDGLLAAGKHPSVDAVRVALGNTGSKTTIHKYLKQLEAEEPALGDRKSTLTDTLATMVASLATQLEREAIVEVEAVRLEASRIHQEHADAAKALRAECDDLLARLGRVETAAHAEATAHEQTRQVLQAESIGRQGAEHKVEGLQERLIENDRHLQSIEEKHQHARASLEHFREAAREHRDQEMRRHEHQVQQLQADLRASQQAQAVKQEAITLQHRESARLAADLHHSGELLRAEQERAGRLTVQVESLRTAEEMGRALTAQVAYLAAQEAVLRDSEAGLKASKETLIRQVRDLELALARTESKLNVHTEMNSRPLNEEPSANAAATKKIGKSGLKNARVTGKLEP